MMISLRTLPSRLQALGPGLALTAAVSVAALAIEHVEASFLGRAWLDGVVLAILLGVAVRSLWRPGAIFLPGVTFSARTLLEVAVMLLGVSISASVVAAQGMTLLVGVAVVVACAILVSYGIGRTMGLDRGMAILIACGNSICGNSAIAATAPVIHADGEDVASAIAFTAVLGVVVVLTLPLLMPVFGLSVTQYGVFAGLTVYAVPQVLAATAPVAAASVQMGTLVKLLRVLMLGPVVLVLSLLQSRIDGARIDAGRPNLRHMVPWFILGFIGLGMLRSAGLIPDVVVAHTAPVSGFLTVLAMAALGLGVDVRSVARAGMRVTATVVLSLAALGLISLVAMRLMGVA
ncbi:YeiH family protein [Kaistia nematophila]|uniref:Sulfate exporter family transporter n=1 Tax=Kaistia nematophila TaxID=2994654 RepID=A0A9X3INZ8_9HYPH|nr:putative sulfate exporter family transporter [Kaistia nematophila]MCX5571430.1 putative sulfate exporter family transporter [Kaistia nematophila]